MSNILNEYNHLNYYLHACIIDSFTNILEFIVNQFNLFYQRLYLKNESLICEILIQF